VARIADVLLPEPYVFPAGSPAVRYVPEQLRDN
jgi:hypothetical protein